MNTTERNWTEPEFKKELPQPLHEFKGVDPSTHINLPELACNRKATNRYYGIVFLLFLLLWFGFTIHMLVTSDLGKFVHGEDDCGNICGLLNVKIQKANCNPKDYRNYPILLYRKDNGGIKKECIKTNGCNRKVVFHRCFDDDEDDKHASGEYFYMVLDAIVHGVVGYVAMVLTAIGACLLKYFCLRWNTRLTLSILLIIPSIGAIITVIVLLICTVGYGVDFYRLFVPLCLCSLFLLIALGVILGIYRRFALVCVMYEEAIATIFASPVLLLTPLLTSFFLLLVDGFGFYMTMVTLSADESVWNTRLSYICIYWIFWLWMCSFTNGLQCMVIAGTIAMYYFNKEKAATHSPFRTSLKIAFRFHLGTVAAGSLIITIVKLAEAIEERLEEVQQQQHRHMDSEDNNAAWRTLLSCLKCCAQSTLCCFREVVEYLTKKAYIMTAIHGKGLISSGKRAATLLWHFLFDTISVDVSGFTLAHFVSLITLIFTMGVGYGMGIVMKVDADLVYLYLILGLILSGTITYFYAALLNVSIETIFLCFCEDRLLNDGSRNKPYFASRRLIEFITDAYKASETVRNKKRPLNVTNTSLNETADTSRQRY